MSDELIAPISLQHIIETHISDEDISVVPTPCYNKFG